jgi:hypothetical protein
LQERPTLIGSTIHAVHCDADLIFRGAIRTPYVRCRTAQLRRFIVFPLNAAPFEVYWGKYFVEYKRVMHFCNPAARHSRRAAPTFGELSLAFKEFAA